MTTANTTAPTQQQQQPGAAAPPATTPATHHALRQMERLKMLEMSTTMSPKDQHTAVKVLLREAQRYEYTTKGINGGGLCAVRGEQSYFERKLWWSNLAEDATDVLEFGVDPHAVRKDAAALQLWVADEEFFPTGELGEVQVKEVKSFHQRRWNVLASLPPGKLFHPTPEAASR